VPEVISESSLLGDGQTVTRPAPGASATHAFAPSWDWNERLTPRTVLLMLPIVGLLVVAYAYPMMRWEAIWRHNAAWSHGYLIPVLAVLVAHYRLKERPPARLAPNLWGLALIVGGCVVRLWAQTMMITLPGEASFLLVLAGVVLLVLGWEMLRAVWVAIAYLVLMIPWDVKYYEGVALPLQTLAAAVAERVLGLFGVLVQRSVNVLEMPSGPITVAEACSGLHLLFAFVALGVLMAFMYRRPWWERLVIMASSVPIAVVCNVIRVTLMAVVSDHLFFQAKRVAEGGETWVPGFVLALFKGDGTVERLGAFRETVLDPQSWLHQSFGFAMLGLAFGLMWLELRAIDMFFVEEDGGGEGGDAEVGGGGNGSVGASSTAGGRAPADAAANPPGAPPGAPSGQDRSAEAEPRGNERP